MSGRHDHFSFISERATSESDVLNKITATGKVLGFDICQEAMLAHGPQLWRHAQAFDLCLDSSRPTCTPPLPRCGLTSLIRALGLNADKEQSRSDIRMRWLACVAHLALDRQLVVRTAPSQQSPLTERELDVLRWTAHGKTSSEISQLLSISEHTVNFHIRNVIAKLHATNKTAAAVRAAMLGWI
jgi:LuxR family transcriptional regulator